MKKNRNLYIIWMLIKGLLVQQTHEFTNIALRKPSKQAATYETRNAEFANDGNNQSISTTNGDHYNHSWWYVDLGHPTKIKSIQIVNTDMYTDAGYIENTFVTISENNNTIYNESFMWSYNRQIIEPGALLVFTKPPYINVSSIGRFITIWTFREARKPLTLAEVYIEEDLALDTTIISITSNWATNNNEINSANTLKDMTAYGSESKFNIIIGAIFGAIGLIALFCLIVLLIYCYLRARDIKKFKELENQPIVLEPVYSIKLDDVERFIIEKKTNINSQFKSLPNDKIKTTSIGFKHNDFPRNRYKNILPFDDNLVPLQIEQGDEPEETYINASFIKGYDNQDKIYIACQGPIKETLKDMWRLIWQFKINNIVMLTQIIENSKKKSEQYWPQNLNEAEIFDKVSVMLIEENLYTHYIHRRFIVEKLNNLTKETLKVNHFQFLSWMDKNRPEDIFTIFSFQKLVRKEQYDSKSPLLVHCSAGVGRTGSYIAIDHLLEEARNEGKVSIFQCVNDLRLQRMLMVQTQTQYEFIYDAMAEFAKFGDSNIPIEAFKDEYENKTRMNQEISKQYTMLDLLRNKDQQSSGKTQTNKSKNRRVDIYAIDDCRTHLPYSEGKEDYINAVFNDTYNMRRGLILTQTPLPTTMDDYWAMVYEYGDHTIVLLEDIDGEDENSPIFWPFNVGELIHFGVYNIKLISAVLEENLIAYSLEIDKEKNISKNVIMYKMAKKKKVPTATRR